MTKKFIVENAVQAKAEVEKLETEGYSRDDVYIFAHYKQREEDISDALKTEKAIKFNISISWPKTFLRPTTKRTKDTIPAITPILP